MVQWIRCLWVAALAFAGGMIAMAADTRAFELRTYVTNEGKLTDLLARFRDHTCALFAPARDGKHWLLGSSGSRRWIG